VGRGLNDEEDRMADVDVREGSVADLVQRLSEQTTTLVRQEMRLMQAELQEKGKRAGIGAGLLGAAGIVGLAALGALVAATILVIGEAVAMWISAFLVTGALLVVAGVMALGSMTASEARGGRNAAIAAGAGGFVAGAAIGAAAANSNAGYYGSGGYGYDSYAYQPGYVASEPAYAEPAYTSPSYYGPVRSYEYSGYNSNYTGPWSERRLQGRDW